MKDTGFIRVVDGRGASEGDVGGKAASLDRLVGQGFPVPRATVVTADGYRAFVRGTGLDAYVRELADADLPPIEEIEAATLAVEQRFLEAPLPTALEQQIAAALEEWLTESPVAVRSSATAEDLAHASFAGQYRTYLNIKTVSEGITAVRRCWASLWFPPAVAYRRAEHIAEGRLAMAVIIQEMAPADWSGVLFTRDPQGGMSQMRIEAIPGLGEDLVSGRVTPNDYVVDISNLGIRSNDQRAPLSFLEDLARIGARVEQLAGSPQDVEWAYTDEGLVVLQSRAITVTRPRAASDDGFDSTGNPLDTFTPRGVEEMLPGVVPPLLWTINRPMLAESFRRLFADLGATGVDPDRVLVGRFRGRAALNLSALGDVAVSLGGRRSTVEEQYLGRPITEDEARQSGRLHVRDALRGWRSRRRIEDEVDLVELAATGVLALEVELDQLPVSRLLAYRRQIRDLAWRTSAAEVAAAAAAGEAYQSLQSYIARWLGDESAAQWAQRVTAGALSEYSVGAARVARVRRLYEEHSRSCPMLADSLCATPTIRTRRRLVALGDKGEAFLDDLDTLLRGFGSEAIYAGPTWDEHADVVFDQLARYARDGLVSPALPDPAAALAALEAELRGVKRWMFWRVVTGQVVDMRIRNLRRLVSDATKHLAARERAKSALLALGGEERRLVIESARRLRASGHLEEDTDVELLADSELEEMLSGGESISATELHRRASTRSAAQAEGALPETFVGHPDALTDDDVEPGLVLHGWAASPGKVRGTARLIDGLTDGSRVGDGDIIVAHSTDPSWTPLFLIAGGIVLEEGGPLSHAAIVAREFGLPAVLNVRRATRSIEDGEQLEVDGTTGTVVRLGAGTAAPAAEMTADA